MIPTNATMTTKQVGRDQPRIFFVCASGFIGYNVLAGVLRQQQRCVVLMREPGPQALARLQMLLSPLGLDVPLLHQAGILTLVQGDLNHDLPQLDHLGIKLAVVRVGGMMGPV